MLYSGCAPVSLDQDTLWSTDEPGAESAGDELDGDVTGNEHPDGPLHPDTILIEREPCFGDVSFAQDREVITLELLCADAVPELAEGRILAGQLHGGYLRRITQLQRPDPYTAIVFTEFATLAEAVVDVELHESWSFGAREITDFSGRVLDEADGSSVLVEHGTLRLQPQLDLDVELGFLRLNKARATLTIELDLDLDATFESDGLTERSGVEEISTHSYPLEWEAGLLDGSGTLDVVIQLGFRHNTGEGESSGRIATSTRGVFEMTGNWERPDSWTSEIVPHYEGASGDLEPVGTDSWEGEVFLIVEATLHLDGVEGSTFKLHPTAWGSALGPCEERSWSTRSAIDGEVVFRMDFFDDGPREDHLPPLDLLAAEDSGIYEGVSDDDETCAASPPDIETGDGEAGDLGSDDEGSTGSGTAPPGAETLDDDETTDAAQDGQGGPNQWVGQCVPAEPIRCGDTISGNTLSDPLATSNMNGYPCNVGNYDGPELVYEWTAPSSGAVEFALVEPRPTQLNQDVFVLDGSGGECSSSLCLDNGANSVMFSALAGQTYLLVVDGFAGQGGSFQATLDCTP